MESLSIKNVPFFFLFVFLFNSASVLSQDGDFIKGQLLDAKTQEPLAFATIRLKGHAVGVISNMDGGFKFPQRFKAMGDNLLISSMGYQTKEVQISTLLPSGINVIAMEPGVLELSETVVSAERKHRLSAKNIVKKAIESISYNYPQLPFATIGYYRDYQMRKGKYVNLNEAIVEVFDQGIGHLDYNTTKIAILDFKENTDFDRDKFAEQPYDYVTNRKTINRAYLPNSGGNELRILRIHDAIRNHNVQSYSFVDRMDVNLLHNHLFSKEPDTKTDKEVLYNISFINELNMSTGGYDVIGHLYISRKDFAIYKMEYALYDHLNRSSTGLRDKNGSDKQLIFEVVEEYARKNSKMYLNYISLHNTFQTWAEPEFRVSNISVDLSLRCLVVEFNDEPIKEDAMNLKKYNADFMGKKIDFRSVSVKNNKVYLFPDLGQEEESKFFSEILKLSKDKKDINDYLMLNIKNILDVNGNRLNKRRKTDFDQFREYFVQQVIPNATPPDAWHFMKLDRPLFRDQSIVKPDNLKDYWMNTPLKKSE